jgi:hypothetical protein
MAVMCARHPTDRMPDRDQHRPEGSGGDGAGQAAAFFGSMQIPDRNCVDLNANKLFSSTNFLLPMGFREAVANHEPDYQLLWKLDYTTLCRPLEGALEPSAAMLREKMPPLSVPDEPCTCVDACGDKCLNR